jgi:biotin carboxyl carrier protein
MKIRVKIDEQTYDVEVGDLNARPILATLEGETFEVWPAEESAELSPAAVEPGCEPTLAAPAPAAAGGPAVDKSKSVQAPIPGVILSVAVKPGDTVKTGQELCLLEAMKMKNAIRANRDGKIANVLVASGETVRHGQVLMEFAD